MLGEGTTAARWGHRACVGLAMAANLYEPATPAAGTARWR